MISLFGDPEPTCDPSPEEDVPQTDKPLALRRLAEMLEEDAAARERQQGGAAQELDELTTRLRDSAPETPPHTAAAPEPDKDRPGYLCVRSTTVLR